eukprot:s3767_g13.t1
MNTELDDDWELVLCDVSRLDAVAFLPRLQRCLQRVDLLLTERAEAIKKIGASNVQLALRSRHMLQFPLSTFARVLLEHYRDRFSAEQNEAMPVWEDQLCHVSAAAREEARRLPESLRQLYGNGVDAESWAMPFFHRVHEVDAHMLDMEFQNCSYCKEGWPGVAYLVTWKAKPSRRRIFCRAPDKDWLEPGRPVCENCLHEAKERAKAQLPKERLTAANHADPGDNIHAAAGDMKMLLIKRCNKDPHRKQQVPFLVSRLRLERALDRLRRPVEAVGSVALRPGSLTPEGYLGFSKRENLQQYSNTKEKGAEPEGLEVQEVKQEIWKKIEKNLFAMWIAMRLSVQLAAQVRALHEPSESDSDADRVQKTWDSLRENLDELSLEGLPRKGSGHDQVEKTLHDELTAVQELAAWGDQPLIPEGFWAPEDLSAKQTQQEMQDDLWNALQEAHRADALTTASLKRHGAGRAEGLPIVDPPTVLSRNHLIREDHPCCIPAGFLKFFPLGHGDYSIIGPMCRSGLRTSSRCLFWEAFVVAIGWTVSSSPKISLCPQHGSEEQSTPGADVLCEAPGELEYRAARTRGGAGFPEEPPAQSSDMATENKDGGGGQFKRFSGADLDGKAYRQCSTCRPRRVRLWWNGPLKVTETFAKCRRKVKVEFPQEAQGWICLHQSGLSEDQRAIVTAKTQGELKLNSAATAMRSCFPDFRASGRSSKPRCATGAMLVDDDDWTEDDVLVSSEPAGSSNDVVFEDVEAFLGEHGVHLEEPPSGEVFTENETVEILAASWKEKRAEIARLQKSRRFNQASIVKKKFVAEVGDVRRQTRCFKCQKVGHWARNCPNKSSKSDDRGSGAAGAAVVWESVEGSEALLVSSPGLGIIDSGCGRTLIGQQTLGAFYRLLAERKKPMPTLKRECNLFRFGNGQQEMSEKVVVLPLGIHGKPGTVEAGVIAGDAPLLLSRSTMRSLGAVLDFCSETLSIRGGQPQPLLVSS